MALELPRLGGYTVERATALALGHHGVGLRPLEAPGLSRERCHVALTDGVLSMMLCVFMTALLPPGRPSTDDIPRVSDRYTAPTAARRHAGVARVSPGLHGRGGTAAGEEAHDHDEQNRADGGDDELT